MLFQIKFQEKNKLKFPKKSFPTVLRREPKRREKRGLERKEREEETEGGDLSKLWNLKMGENEGRGCDIGIKCLILRYARRKGR